MARFSMTRESYIRQGSVEVRDDQSDAVAFVYEAHGKLGALLFYGKQAKPVWHFLFSTVERRDAKVQEGFAARRFSLAYKAQQRQERKGAGRGLEVGDLLVASWGYEQTNVDAYQVTALIGSTMVELRPIRVEQVSGCGFEHYGDRGYCRPAKDAFKGQPFRKVAKDGYVAIDSIRSASKWKGGPLYWSSYA